MAYEEQTEPLLDDESLLSSHSQRNSLGFSKAHILVLCLTISNLVLLFDRFTPRQQTPYQDFLPEASKFAGLLYDTPMIYSNWTEFQSLNQTVKNDAWKAVDNIGLDIMYTHAEATELGLPISNLRLPWDDSQGIYAVKVFHDLHCLKVLHRIFRNIQVSGAPPSEEASEHVYHCLDALRQDLMCQANDTPSPLTAYPDTVADGQTMTCRNWERLLSWTRSVERNPCFRRATRSFDDGIIEFMWCPEDSPYRERQQAYLVEFGHLHKADFERQGWDTTALG